MVSIEDAVRRIPAGRYIVAVSGGVDSMALLAALVGQRHLHIMVAHANHGIRTDSAEDETLVRTFCKSHNIAYTHKLLYLDAHASEAEARNARYLFLRKCLTDFGARAIITAHHQDDLIETAFLNILRGTDWRGLAPFVVASDVLRPLLDVPKKMLIAYAAQHNVPWREDSTNANQALLRNYLRRTYMPLLDVKDPAWRIKFLQQIRKQQLLRRTIEAELATSLTYVAAFTEQTAVLRRHHLIMLPEQIAYELLQLTCKHLLGNSILKDQADAALLFAKVARPGKRLPLNAHWQVRATATSLFVEPS